MITWKHMDPLIFFIYLARKVAFGVAVGFSLYIIFLFGRPFVEMKTDMKFEDDFWFWSVVAGSIIIGFLCFLIV